MSEFYRVLKPNGWAILLVPIIGDKTIEDPAITTPEERGGCMDSMIMLGYMVLTASIKRDLKVLALRSRLTRV